MRTFHTGGVASGSLTESDIKAGVSGTVEYGDLGAVEAPNAEGTMRTVTLRKNGTLKVVDAKGRELEKHKVPYGGTLVIKNGGKVKVGETLVEFDPHVAPILAEKPGKVKYEDIEEGETVRRDTDRKSGAEGEAKLIVVEHKGERNPRVTVVDEDGKILDFHYLPAKARIEVADGQDIVAGQTLARQPRESAKTMDITGGLPRVTELFEARKPKDPAVLSEISGTIELQSERRKNKMTIVVRNETGMEKEHHVPQDKELAVHTGDYVDAGDPLIRGPVIPHDILRIKGEEALHTYLLTEIQNVYRSQGVRVNEKHIEVIAAQMLRKLKIDDAGDSGFLPGEVVERHRFLQRNDELTKSVRVTEPGGTNLLEGQLISKDEFKDANEQAEAEGKDLAKSKKPRVARAKTLLLGITKASLSSESFISAASFQETTKVLTEAAMAGMRDTLNGLKENVILGHLIPAGTGFGLYQDMTVLYPGTDQLEADDAGIERVTQDAGAVESRLPSNDRLPQPAGAAS
jgi:DNA-directed RNA polymerase subunit beta'